MSRKEYPRIGSDRPIKGKRICHCCQLVASRKVDIQVNWFRGDDEVLQLFSTHYAFIAAQTWKELFVAAEEEKERRRKQNEVARERAEQRKMARANPTAQETK